MKGCFIHKMQIQWWFFYLDTFVPGLYFRINEFSGLLNHPLVRTWKSVPTFFVRTSEISGLSEPGLMNHHCKWYPVWLVINMLAIGRSMKVFPRYFYAPGLKGPPGASSVWIVCPSVRPFVRPSVRNSVPLINKVQYLKFGWSYSNQTWNVSSSKDCSHFTDITCPWGWGRVKM